MEQWSLFFTLLALAGVVLALAGAWWMVRSLRGRRSRGSENRADSSRSTR